MQVPKNNALQINVGPLSNRENYNYALAPYYTTVKSK